jgi:benzoate membrane transport protein
MSSRPGAPAPEVTSSVPITAISSATPPTLAAIAAMSLPLAAAQAFDLTGGQTTALIMACYGIPGIIGVALTLLYRQPVLIGWSIGGVVFVAALAIEFSYQEVLGAIVVSGIAVALIGIVGLSTRIAALVPAPVIFGILAGSIMPFVVRIFSDMTRYPLVIGAMVGAFLLGRRLLPARFPPILLALFAGGLLALLSGEVSRPAEQWSFPVPIVTMPSFTWQAIISIAPIMVIFIAVQGNLTGAVYLRSQRYKPPERNIDMLTGGGTMLAAFFGAAPISTASAIMPLVAGPDAGPVRTRYWGAFTCSAATIVVALGASLAATLPAIVPVSLLYALAGLALLGVLAQALGEISRGPLLLGPLFAFVVASSQLTLLGLGPVFWALVIGMGVTMLLEADGYGQLHAPG